MKPPYGLLNAVDLNKAEIVWQIPFGITPAFATIRPLQGVSLPPQLGAPGAQGGIVTKGGLIFIGGGDQSFHAVDKTNGKDLWSFPTGRRTTSNPATYRTKSGKQFVVIAVTGGQGPAGGSALLAFALP